MKNKLLRSMGAVLCVLTMANCTTAYDAYGRPRPVVDPGAALLGVAAAGLIGYGLAQGSDHRHHSSGYYNRGCDRSYGYGRGHYHSGYSRGYYGRSCR